MNTSHVHKACGGFLAIAVAAMALAAPTVAGNLTGPDVKVAYSDLDIDTADGASQLLKRINGAASRVCASLDHGDIASRANVAQCHQKLTAAAVAKVNHPVLAAIYKSAHPDASPVATLTN